MSFVHFLIVSFFKCCFQMSLDILHMNPLYIFGLANIFFGLYFHNSWKDFSWIIFFILMKSNLSIFSFMDGVFGIMSKIFSRSPKLAPTFSSRSFIALHFIFNSYVTLNLFLYKIWDLGQNAFFPSGCSIAPAPVFVKSILPPFNCFCNFVENQFPYLYGGISMVSFLIYSSNVHPATNITVSIATANQCLEIW